MCQYKSVKTIAKLKDAYCTVQSILVLQFVVQLTIQKSSRSLNIMLNNILNYD